MLFLHSAGASSEIWQYQHAYFLEAGYRVAAFDRRGHGRSEPTATGYDADTLADDLARTIDVRGLQAITLIGHSVGCGKIVRYLARHGAERIARIILVGTTTPFLWQTADNPTGIERTGFESLRGGWRQDYPRWLAENARPFSSRRPAKPCSNGCSSRCPGLPSALPSRATEP
ncbi:MAG: alpha/beta fold hydrolase [Acetobacteraceae bacterium]